jgi:hypothetical protein
VNFLSYEEIEYTWLVFEYISTCWLKLLIIYASSISCLLDIDFMRYFYIEFIIDTDHLYHEHVWSLLQDLDFFVGPFVPVHAALKVPNFAWIIAQSQTNIFYKRCMSFRILINPSLELTYWGISYISSTALKRA